uniref:tRNA_int_endo_N domain-containing protein n=1 Tax=Heterorhabditis bacteriophora TaxID=37862 RepID=A0A1I7X569_HETBA
MDLIAHDPKDCSTSYPRSWLPHGLIRAVIFGGSVIIPDSNEANNIYKKAGFGHFLGERQDRVNKGVFCNHYEQWKMKKAFGGVVCYSYIFLFIFRSKPFFKDKSPTSDRLRLSPEETAFLVIDEGVLEVSEQGHILPTMIYRDGPQFFHAAAGVRIEDEIEPCQYIALNRALTNMKKVVIVHILISLFVNIRNNMEHNTNLKTI